MKIFEKWLLNRIDERSARTYINYLNKYLTNVCSANLQELLLKINNGKNWFIKAVRNLLNFAEEREDLNDEFIVKVDKKICLKRLKHGVGCQHYFRRKAERFTEKRR